MAIGYSQKQQRFENPREILGDRLREGSIYRLLADYGHEMFPDDYFSDLYTDSKRGRPTIPARVMATVMLLQAFEGLSDREAIERLEFDLRWKAAAQVDTGAVSFHPTALVGQRNRLRASQRPRRLFEDTKIVAKQTGAMKSRVRVLDSTPIYDAVATQDTVTQLRAAIRKLLVALDFESRPLAAKVRAALRRDDDYATRGKPPCDWDDKEAREALVDELVHDALYALDALNGEEIPILARDGCDLLALVAGQDVEMGEDGIFRIQRKVAKDRVISTVDVEARHGHKSRKRHFDGYKAHLSVDPDSELIDEVSATKGNVPDRDAVEELVAPLKDEDNKPEVLGDSAYADGSTRNFISKLGLQMMAKCPPIRNATGGFTKEYFDIDLNSKSVTCPAGQVVPITPTSNGGRATFANYCGGCPLKSKCTTSLRGRTISIHAYEEILQKARKEQQDPNWTGKYRADRPIVERKIAHFVRKPWGGRNARTRGIQRVATDLYSRAGAINWARLATLGLNHDGDKWVLGPS